jgi:hypothetical protein
MIASATTATAIATDERVGAGTDEDECARRVHVFIDACRRVLCALNEGYEKGGDTTGLFPYPFAELELHVMAGIAKNHLRAALALGEMRLGSDRPRLIDTEVGRGFVRSMLEIDAKVNAKARANGGHVNAFYALPAAFAADGGATVAQSVWDRLGPLLLCAPATPATDVGPSERILMLRSNRVPLVAVPLPQSASETRVAEALAAADAALVTGEGP